MCPLGCQRSVLGPLSLDIPAARRGIRGGNLKGRAPKDVALTTVAFVLALYDAAPIRVVLVELGELGVRACLSIAQEVAASH